MHADSDRGWRREELIHGGDEFFARTLAAIESAKTCIDFEVFIFKMDRLGSKIAQALCDASRRGVQVRLLLDGVGSWDFGQQDLNAFTEAGVNYHFYHPLPWHPRSEGIAVSLARLNRRNHRKLWIVDQETAFVGSMNVTEVHSEAYSGKRAWRDIGAIVEGPGVIWLRMAFETAWGGRESRIRWRTLSRELSKTDPRRAGRALVELNRSFASRRRKNRALVRRILNANQRVWLINPYFVPSFSLIAALKAASHRNVDVRIVVPRHSDVFFMPIIARRYFGWLMKQGVKIHEYQDGMLHAKIALIDDWVRIGSSNLNHRSLLHDLEVNVVLGGKSTIQSVEKRILNDLSVSTQIALSDWRRRGWARKMLESLVGLLRRWI